jgi:hypothetical protein
MPTGTVPLYFSRGPPAPLGSLRLRGPDTPRRCATLPSNIVALVVGAQFQPCMHQLDVVRRNLVTQ